MPQESISPTDKKTISLENGTQGTENVNVQEDPEVDNATTGGVSASRRRKAVHTPTEEDEVENKKEKKRSYTTIDISKFNWKDISAFVLVILCVVVFTLATLLVCITIPDMQETVVSRYLDSLVYLLGAGTGYLFSVNSNKAK